ncbi:DNA replication and repair protein RecN [Spirosomataceae bacterium TFI 002]|nr:DNA replication and repair protein RecN [Spirosomataceae bacterium TFI 002]
MLQKIHIQNFALIDKLHITLDSELNIITGETGAGKSIILGALGLLMGNRADVNSLLDPDSKCVVEGEFDLQKMNLKQLFGSFDLDYDNTCIIRREIAPNGKSRAFINDTPVTLDILKAISSKLVDVHSQHDSVLLGSSAYQLDMIDAFAGNEEEVFEYKQAFHIFKKASSELEKLKKAAVNSQKDFDYNSFLLEELVEANIKAGEKEAAEEELNILENAEEVKTRLASLMSLFNNPEHSMIEMLRDASATLNPIVSVSKEYLTLKERISSVLIELSDIADEVEQKEGDLALDEERIAFLKDRLDVIFRLMQKHGVQDEEALLKQQNDLSIKVADVLDFDSKLQKLSRGVEQAKIEVEKIAQSLSKKRKGIVKDLNKKVILLLKELGITNADFDMSFEDKPLDETGQDEVSFLFSANKGIALQPLKKVASGGEFSRLMLVLKYYLAEKKSLPTIIFDEIDTGISGEVAIKMGALLRKMSTLMQVAAITHLHQIAGKGTSHFFVYKIDGVKRTFSNIKKLDEDERVIEIAKMIGGQNPSESAIKSALEVLQN